MGIKETRSATRRRRVARRAGPDYERKRQWIFEIRMSVSPNVTLYWFDNLRKEWRLYAELIGTQVLLSAVADQSGLSCRVEEKTKDGLKGMTWLHITSSSPTRVNLFRNGMKTREKYILTPL